MKLYVKVVIQPLACPAGPYLVSWFWWRSW